MINYRETTGLAAAIRQACPEGNDIVFDNTGSGGSVTSSTITGVGNTPANTMTRAPVAVRLDVTVRLKADTT